jgi:hypothetical protein
MTKNTLTDLNNHLFAQIERLGDEELTDEQLNNEIARAKAINGVAGNIINNAKVALEGMDFSYRKMNTNGEMPEQFKLKEKND